MDTATKKPQSELGMINIISDLEDTVELLADTKRRLESVVDSISGSVIQQVLDKDKREYAKDCYGRLGAVRESIVDIRTDINRAIDRL